MTTSADVVIRVENLGKKYRLHHQAKAQRYVALRDVIAEKSKALLRGLGSLAGRRGAAESDAVSARDEDFWALRDVSFEIKQGEVVGIIGRNGAGKSTLLKVLSQITEPTTGRIGIKGRLGSLLEVGTGFHPELTGRENIFLNGAILGMSKAEIDRKFDEIVAFAEVERFLDTPVKHYSSGMYVRLAFAVAAHLEPEILIVDEVLAVGDSQFQEKCLGKMREISGGEGRTVLFVSHNMASIRQLCSTTILLRQGQVQQIGPTEVIVNEYARMPLETGRRLKRTGTGRLQFAQFHLENESRQVVERIHVGDNLYFVLTLLAQEEIRYPHFSVEIKNAMNQCFAHITGDEGEFVPAVIPAGRYQLRVKVENLNFCPGRYDCDLWVAGGDVLDHVRDCLPFEIDPNPHSKRRVEYPLHVNCFPNSVWEFGGV